MARLFFGHGLQGAELADQLAFFFQQLVLKDRLDALRRQDAECDCRLRQCVLVDLAAQIAQEQQPALAGRQGATAFGFGDADLANCQRQHFALQHHRIVDGRDHAVDEDRAGQGILLLGGRERGC